MALFKSAAVSPDSVFAGDSDNFKITLIIGKKFPAKAFRLIFDFQCTLGTSRPSLYHQENDGYIEVYIDNPNITYKKQIWNLEKNDFATPADTDFQKLKAARQFVLDVSEGVKENDTIIIAWGNNSRGYTPGAKITSIVPYPGYKSKINVRYFKDPKNGLPDLGRSFKGYRRPRPDYERSLYIEIKPREPKYLQVIRKTDSALAVIRDKFWNPVFPDNHKDIITTESQPVINESGTLEFEEKNVVIFPKGLESYDSVSMERVWNNKNIYWGDIHTHSAYSFDCIEREMLSMNPIDLMNYARNISGLDFFAVSDHHQPWDEERRKIGKLYWEQTIEDIHGCSNKNFIVFPAIEYRCARGDTVILFGWDPAYDEIDDPSLSDIRDVWKKYAGKNYISIPHFHNGGRLKSNEWWDSIHDSSETVIELFSCHGSYESDSVLEHHIPLCKQFRTDRNAAWFLGQGYKYGLVCNSDGHKGHVGSNGLTAVYAENLDRKSILDAYKKRNVYGTTNARIRLLFTADDNLMGSVLKISKKVALFIELIGERDFKKIDLIQNGKIVQTFSSAGKVFRKEINFSINFPCYMYIRATQIDNHIAYSSPVWFE